MDIRKYFGRISGPTPAKKAKIESKNSNDEMPIAEASGDKTIFETGDDTRTTLFEDSDYEDYGAEASGDKAIFEPGGDTRTTLFEDSEDELSIPEPSGEKMSFEVGDAGASLFDHSDDELSILESSGEALEYNINCESYGENLDSESSGEVELDEIELDELFDAEDELDNDVEFTADPETKATEAPSKGKKGERRPPRIIEQTPKSSNFLYNRFMNAFGLIVPSGVVIRTLSSFFLAFSSRYSIPLFVVHSISTEQLIKDPDNKHPFSFIFTSWMSATHKLYAKGFYGSGYDKGHFAPSGDFRSDESARSSTYIYDNAAPMLPFFNRWVWHIVETYVRMLVPFLGKDLIVVTGAIVGKDSKRLQENGIVVPESFYKILIDASGAKPKMLCFLVPHVADMDIKILPNYVVSFATIQEVVQEDQGFILFPSVGPSGVEQIQFDNEIFKNAIARVLYVFRTYGFHDVTNDTLQNLTRPKDCFICGCKLDKSCGRVGGCFWVCRADRAFLELRKSLTTECAEKYKDFYELEPGNKFEARVAFNDWLASKEGKQVNPNGVPSTKVARVKETSGVDLRCYCCDELVIADPKRRNHPLLGTACMCGSDFNFLSGRNSFTAECVEKLKEFHKKEDDYLAARVAFNDWLGSKEGKKVNPNGVSTKKVLQKKKDASGVKEKRCYFCDAPVGHEKHLGVPGVPIVSTCQGDNAFLISRKSLTAKCAEKYKDYVIEKKDIYKARVAFNDWLGSKEGKQVNPNGVPKKVNKLKPWAADDPRRKKKETSGAGPLCYCCGQPIVYVSLVPGNKTNKMCKADRDFLKARESFNAECVEKFKDFHGLEAGDRFKARVAFNDWLGSKEGKKVNPNGVTKNVVRKKSLRPA